MFPLLSNAALSLNDMDGMSGLSSLFVARGTLADLDSRTKKVTYQLSGSSSQGPMSGTSVVEPHMWTDTVRLTTAQMLLFYCYLSAISFPVNLYLGLRFCSDEDPARLRWIAKVTYAIGCLLNWSLQWKLFEHSAEAYCYLALLALIVYDDIVLLRWLWR